MHNLLYRPQQPSFVRRRLNASLSSVRKKSIMSLPDWAENKESGLHYTENCGSNSYIQDSTQMLKSNQLFRTNSAPGSPCVRKKDNECENGSSSAVHCSRRSMGNFTDSKTLSSRLIKFVESFVLWGETYKKFCNLIGPPVSLLIQD